MELRSGDAVLQRWTVNGNFTDYIYRSNTPISQNIKVYFINDYYKPPEDRNLIVDYISINGTVYQSESQGVYAQGNYSFGTGCAGGFKKVETLHCQNSYFEYPVVDAPQPAQTPAPPLPAPLEDFSFDTNNNEFVLNDKTAMDFLWGRGVWLSNKRIKVYRNIHGSDWIPVSYGTGVQYGGFTLDPLTTLIPKRSGSGVVYINDGTAHWANNPYQVPVNESRFESRVGLGYTKQTLVYRDIDLNVNYFVPSYDISDPVVIQLVEIRNLSNTSKNLNVFSFQDVIPTGTATFDNPQNALILSSSPGLFLTATEPLNGFDASFGSFFGSGGEPAPAAVVAKRLTGSLASADSILAGQVNIRLQPGEVKKMAFVMGTYGSATERKQLISKYRDIQNIQAALNDSKQFYLAKTNNIPGINSLNPKMQTQLRVLGFSALSTSMWWDKFINKFTLNQMAQYLDNVNARDTAQIALGLLYLDPNLSREGLEAYFHGQQYPNGQIPYGTLSLSTRFFTIDSDPNSPTGHNNWGSDNIAWMTLASCEYVNKTGDTSWLNKNLPYNNDSSTDTIYNHIIKAFNFDYTRNVKPNGLIDNQGGDWLDHTGGYLMKHGESVYSSALLYHATQKCLPLMTASDKNTYQVRANNLKNAIEKNAYDALSGRYVRNILTNGRTVGGSQDSRIFSDLAVLSLNSDFNPARVKRTVLAAYNTNTQSQNKGNPVYTPSYPGFDESLGNYTIPDWYYDNKIWGRVCALVSVALNKQGLRQEAQDNFNKCLPDKQNPNYGSPFNYIEIYDPRGNTTMALEQKLVSQVSFSDAVDDAMAIWAQAEMHNAPVSDTAFSQLFGFMLAPFKWLEQGWIR